MGAAAKTKGAFKLEHPLERRQAEAALIRQKYPDRIPVIVEKERREVAYQILTRRKMWRKTAYNYAPPGPIAYLVPADLSVGQFVYVVRKRVKLSPEKAIFIFVKNVLPPTVTMMSAV